MHAWRSPETCTFAAFIYEKGKDRLLQYMIGTDKDDVILRPMDGAAQPHLQGSGRASPYHTVSGLLYRAGTFVYNDERETRISELMAERSRYLSESFTWAGPDHSQMK
jgi:hypothetical protein